MVASHSWVLCFGSLQGRALPWGLQLPRCIAYDIVTDAMVVMAAKKIFLSTTIVSVESRVTQLSWVVCDLVHPDTPKELGETSQSQCGQFACIC